MHQKLCANCLMLFKQKFLIFQFINLASSFNTFPTKLSKAKKKKGKEGVLLQNKSKQGAFFLFQAVIGYISFNHGTS